MHSQRGVGPKTGVGAGKILAAQADAAQAGQDPAGVSPFAALAGFFSASTTSARACRAAAKVSRNSSRPSVNAVTSQTVRTVPSAAWAAGGVQLADQPDGPFQGRPLGVGGLVDGDRRHQSLQKGEGSKHD